MNHDVNYLVNKNLFPRERVGVFHVVRTTLVGSPSEGSSACFGFFGNHITAGL